jgi:hypothetical protein
VRTPAYLQLSEDCPPSRVQPLLQLVTNYFGAMVRASPPDILTGAQAPGNELLLSSAALKCLAFAGMRAGGGGIYEKAPVAHLHDTVPGINLDMNRETE